MIKKDRHVMLFIPFLIFVRDATFLTFGHSKCFRVRTELIDFILRRRDVSKVTGVHVQKAVTFLQSRMKISDRLWDGLWELPVILSGYNAAHILEPNMSYRNRDWE